MSTLLHDIEAFMSRYGMSEWTFGQGALNDRHFVRQLRAEREPRRMTEARVRTFMAEYRPADATPERTAA